MGSSVLAERRTTSSDRAAVIDRPTGISIPGRASTRIVIPKTPRRWSDPATVRGCAPASAEKLELRSRLWGADDA